MTKHINFQGERPERLARWIHSRIASSLRPRFSYLGIQERPGDDIKVIKGALILNADSPSPSETFSVGHLVADCVVLDGDAGFLDALCSAIAEGTFSIGTLTFTMVSPSTIGVERVEFDVESGAPGYQQNAPSLCRVIGERHGMDVGPAVDWLLKAATPPYDSLIELADSFSLGPIGETANVDIVALQLAMIDAKSAVHDACATVAILILAGMDRTRSSIGFRVITNGTAIRRGSIRADTMTWTDVGGLQRGEATLALNPGEMVQAYAVYGGRAHHQYWVFDPAHTQNPRRAAYEAVDDGLLKLRSWLKGEGKKPADDFEFAVSTLAWLLGFATLHYERSIVSDSPDVVLAFGAGLILVECTLGAFAPDKASRLELRARNVQQRLVASGHGWMPVRCVIATAVSEDAHGNIADVIGDVHVLSREGLLRLVERTVLFPDAERLFAEFQGTLAKKTDNAVKLDD